MFGVVFSLDIVFCFVFEFYVFEILIISLDIFFCKFCVNFLWFFEIVFFFVVYGIVVFVGVFDLFGLCWCSFVVFGVEEGVLGGFFVVFGCCVVLMLEGVILVVEVGDVEGLFGDVGGDVDVVFFFGNVGGVVVV